MILTYFPLASLRQDNIAGGAPVDGPDEPRQQYARQYRKVAAGSRRFRYAHILGTGAFAKHARKFYHVLEMVTTQMFTMET